MKETIIDVISLAVTLILLIAICSIVGRKTPPPTGNEPEPYAICPYCGAKLDASNCGGVCCADAKN